MPYELKKCEICGREFLPKNQIQKYCGFECQQISNRERAKILMRKRYAQKKEENGKCPICGKTFKKKNGNQIYCGSAECRKERMREYSRERWASRGNDRIEKPIKRLRKGSIAAVTEAAREMNMSYGEYVARYMA